MKSDIKKQLSFVNPFFTFSFEKQNSKNQEYCIFLRMNNTSLESYSTKVLLCTRSIIKRHLATFQTLSPLITLYQRNKNKKKDFGNSENNTLPRKTCGFPTNRSVLKHIKVFFNRVLFNCIQFLKLEFFLLFPSYSFVIIPKFKTIEKNSLQKKIRWLDSYRRKTNTTQPRNNNDNDLQPQFNVAIITKKKF